MSRIWQICLREVRAYFLSPLAYIVMTAFLLLNGLIFYLILNAFSRPDAPSGSVMQIFLGRNVFYWFFILLFSAAITMRLFAEERRSGTIEVLMTAPVTDTEAVLGKYLGALIFYLALWTPTLVYVIMLKRFSPIDPGPIASGYLYVLLTGAMFLALGLLMSILTKSQIIAAIASLLLMLSLFLVPVLFEGMLSAGGILRDVFSYMNLWNQVGDFSKGIVDSRPLVYCLSATGLLLFLCVRALSALKGR